MSTFKTAIHHFFKNYEKGFQDALKGESVDAEKVAAQFAAYFIEASPKGVMSAHNDKKFIASIPEGYEHYRQIGTQSMKIGEQTITLLDTFHAMVKIHWLSTYLRKDGKKVAIDFDVIYFLQKIGDEPKIFAFIAGDEEGLLKENGLLPE
ncbi:hypothetical protein [Chitinophaga sp. RAB17]|uniref:hypothetical protein n=1 Tax=Chitinophaga sp. RAB17 TaxID=3233049 RepID=UPI003F92D322